MFPVEGRGRGRGEQINYWQDTRDFDNEKDDSNKSARISSFSVVKKREGVGGYKGGAANIAARIYKKKHRQAKEDVSYRSITLANTEETRTICIYTTGSWGCH